MQIGKTQFKTILFIGMLAIFFTALLFLIKENEEKKLIKILAEETNTKKILIDNVLDLVGKGLESWVFNDTYWDEMVACVENKNTKWGNDIIATSLFTYNAQAAWLYQTDFSLAYSTNSLNDLSFINFPLSKSELASMFSKKSFNHFFINTKAGLLEVRTAPVQPSLDVKRKTTPRGYFIAGRLWTQDYLNNINLLTTSRAVINLLESPRQDSRYNQKYSISVSKALNDFGGNPFAEIIFAGESKMLRESSIALNWQLTTGIVLTLGLLFAISFFLIRYVLTPLKKISYSLENEESTYLENLSRDRNEFGRIARMIKDFFRQKEELKGANETKDKFISIIAHDLRGPFNGFLGLTEILAKEAETMTTVEVKKLSAELHKSAKTQYRLLSDLLQWSRIQSGRMEFNPTNIKLNDLVELSFEVHKPNAESKNILLIKNFDSNFEIYSDSEMMQVVIRNLISNAVKFTESGGSVTISAKQSFNSSEILITDTGVGIPEQDIHKLFRIDLHLSTDGTNNEKGTGLGLVLCKEIIEKHSGKISVESAVGNGTTFIISLPLAH
ncbi:MAG: Signal transduction histidine kinase [Ignavibacteria bacterium]|nr:MAG: Signal transduction histidine kinase [Ignavibacteria bacterium]KAF0157186.1 MAG: Signal transduction histidine kinase [Ignavibacteria bacterium]